MPKKTKSAWMRTQTTILIAMMVLSAFGVASCSRSWDARLEHNEKAVATFIEKHDCVVAHMTGRVPLTYRCDKLDGGRYLQSHDLGAMALYEYEHPAPALYGASASTP